MAKRKKVLMIAYYFPPLGGSGAIRPFKLAKYLPENDWDPVISTVKNHDWYYGNDPSLLYELPAEVSIIKSYMIISAWIYRLLNPLRIKKLENWIKWFIILPDDQVGWIPLGYLQAIKLIEKYNIDAVYSTSAPLSCHIIAYLAKRKLGIPWIADFRDEWYENPDFYFPTNYHRKFQYWMESLIVNKCDKVVTAAPVFARLLQKHTAHSDKFSSLMMGFDPDDFGIENEVANNQDQPKAFTIVFSGLFYGSFRPTPILEAAQELISEGKIAIGSIKIVFVGANSKADTGFDDKYGIGKYRGFIPHRSAIKQLKKADALLLLLSNDRGKNVIPSKIFEYIATGKPILAVVPSDGEVAKIISDLNAGVVADYHKPKYIKEALYDFYKHWEAGSPIVSPRQDRLQDYNQREITKRFASLLDDMVF